MKLWQIILTITLSVPYAAVVVWWVWNVQPVREFIAGATCTSLFIAIVIGVAWLLSLD